MRAATCREQRRAGTRAGAVFMPQAAQALAETKAAAGGAWSRAGDGSLLAAGGDGSLLAGGRAPGGESAERSASKLLFVMSDEGLIRLSSPLS